MSHKTKFGMRFHANFIFLLGLFVILTGFVTVLSQDAMDDSHLADLITAKQESDDNLHSIRFSNVTIQDGLEILADKINVGFSYNPDDLPKKRVSFSMVNVPGHELIYKLLEGTNLEPITPPTRDVIILRKKEAKFEFDIIQEVVRGTVVDVSTGEPLPGVNVIVAGAEEAHGSIIGTTTDMNGTYQIEVPEGLNTLIFTYVGYQRLEVNIDGRNEIDVQLSSDDQLLDDIVVVGYGTQDRSEITSSVATISEENFVRGNIQDAEQLIQGKVAGLIISRPGGDPNADFNIRLRGLSTIGANTEPLVIIDGMIGASLNTVDPNDIESIDVLKDASASAIYGTRGANGVILVTTKTGRSDQAKGVSVTYNSQVSTQIVGNSLDMLSASEFREFSNQNPGISINDFGFSTNWFDEITQNAYTHTHGISVSGGDASTSYRISGNYRDVQAIQKGVGQQRLNTRVNVLHRALNDRLRLQGNLVYSNREEDVGLPEVFRYAIVSNPTAPVKNPDGSFFEQDGFDIYNPVSINEQSIIERDRRQVNVSFRAEYELDILLEGLSASVFYTRETDNDFRGEFYGKNARFLGAGRNGLARRNTEELRSNLYEATMGYQTRYSWGRIESVAGYSFQDFHRDGQYIEGGDFLTEDFSFYSIAGANDFDEGLGSVSSFRDINELMAFFGRVNLIFDNTYFLSTSIRREGSSRFGPDNKWGNFYAVSGGIDLTNLLDITIADELKLRVSYGKTGQDAPTSGISSLQFEPGASFIVDNQFSPSLSPIRNPNPELKWEVKREINFGLDFALFDNRLSGAFDYYRNNTQDLLLEFIVPVPPNLFPVQWVNIGELKNQGLELAVTYNAVQSTNTNWDTSLTFSTFETILESLSSDELSFGDRRLIAFMGSPGGSTLPMIRVQEGQPIGDIFGKRFAAIGDDGEWLFYDQNENIVTSDEIKDEDWATIGNGLPDFSIGWDNRFGYKNWELNMFWRGVFGHDLINQFNQFYKNPSMISGWNITKSTTTDVSELRESPQFSSFYVEDASFFRLENLTIGYNFNLSDNSLIRNFRVFASGNNLWTITNYEGIDPEVRFEDAGNPLAPGIERRNQWFTQTSFTLGLNLSF